MNHRIVSAVVYLLLAVFVVVALLFAWVAEVRGPERAQAAAPDIPHPPEQRDEDCRRCHIIAEGSLPVTHRAFTLSTCDECHDPSPRVLIPHSIAMGETGCPTCHGDPIRDFGVPENHLDYEPGQCMLCHPVDGDRVNDRPRPAGLARSNAPDVVHEVTGIFESCPKCHQMTGEFRLPDNHRWLEQSTCLQCHEAPSGDRPPGGAANSP